jgi:DtxR family transcriptional regulator, manganese transport regulator
LLRHSQWAAKWRYGSTGSPRQNADCTLQPWLHISDDDDIVSPPNAIRDRDETSEGGLAMRERRRGRASEDTQVATEAAQARRFSKARTARSAATLEDYAELIAELIAANGEARMADIARRLGVAHPTVSKTIARLKREGLVTARPYRGIFLTEAGLAMARSVHQRHRLVVDVLLALGAPREAAEADAEGIEHYVSATTLRAFEAFLREGGRR